MRTLKLCLVAIVVAISPMVLTACAGIGGVAFDVPPAAVVSTAGTTQDEKRLYDAELGYKVAYDTWASAYANKSLSPATLKSTGKILLEADKYLDLARSARRTANQTEFSAQLALAIPLIAQARSLLPSR